MEQHNGVRGRRDVDVRQVAYIALFAALTAALGYVVVPLPFSLVPISGQTLGVMLAGTLLGRRAGAMSVIVLILLGLVGAPVFAGGTSGIGVLAGPRGGYILGFVVAAWVIGFLVERQRTPKLWLYALANVLGGIIVVYVIGVWRLAAVTEMSWKAAVLTSALPFIPGDIVKVAVASIVAEQVNKIKPLRAGNRGFTGA